MAYYFFHLNFSPFKYYFNVNLFPNENENALGWLFQSFYWFMCVNVIFEGALMFDWCTEYAFVNKFNIQSKKTICLIDLTMLSQNLKNVWIHLVQNILTVKCFFNAFLWWRNDKTNEVLFECKILFLFSSLPLIFREEDNNSETEIVCSTVFGV